MFKTIYSKNDYIHSVDVENIPIDYENKMEVNLFGNKILVEKNEWMWHLHLKLTDACNAKCKFCVEQNSNCEENAVKYVEKLDNVLSEMEKEGILYSVSVTGGEPLLFKKFKELCDVLNKHDIKFLTMNTNGSLLNKNIRYIDGLFDFVDISRHSISDKRNDKIFNSKMPTIKELKEIKRKLKDTKMRIQCVMYEIKSIEDLMDFINVFNFADDISFRRLMKLPNEYGISYDTNDDLYHSILEYAFDNFTFKEQTIQDYYVYEIWNYSRTDITFSYSNMNLLNKIEGKEPKNICREFILHPNSIFSGSWNFNNKVIYK